MTLEQAMSGMTLHPPSSTPTPTLEERIAALETKNARLEARVAYLEKENARLREENARLREENARLREDNARLLEDNARLQTEMKRVIEGALRRNGRYVDREGGEDSCCSVCLEIGTDMELVRCMHKFHGDCVLTWIRLKVGNGFDGTCPDCRDCVLQRPSR